LKISGRRVIYDVHEDLPRQIEYKDWIPKLLRKPVSMLAEAVEYAAARIFDRIVPATPTIAARFPPTKTTIVQNYPVLDELVCRDGLEGKSSNLEQFAYVGGLSPERGAFQMIAALESAKIPLARLVIAGRGSESLLTELRTLRGWQKVDYKGHVDRRDVASILATARAGLVLYHPLASHVDAQPNKLFEYMSAGRPVIASDFPLWRKIVADRGAGLMVNPNDPECIAGAMRWILDNPDEAQEMGRRGRAAVVDEFNWCSEGSHLLSLYASLHQEH
jgi:glycosyltransferase involved in cell wall biosynthesis